MPNGSAAGASGTRTRKTPASAASTELIEQARLAVLAHFNAPPEEYAAIFTPNATGACRLVGEAYPFSRRTRLVLTWDNLLGLPSLALRVSVGLASHLSDVERFLARSGC